jgi:peptidoglycan/xylan/chitin deacetylase (PgdA/CDA1 family)
MPRKLLTAPHGVESVPDVPNFSWAEYGLRCGMPRFLDAMGRREIPVSCAINAAAIEAYPSLAEAILRAGWEFVGHGLHQKSVQAEASEREMIAEALARLRAFTGKPVQGWLGPGLKETGETPDLLKAEGVRYCMDWVLDDLPCWMATRHGKMIAMPYTLEINDSVLHAVYQFPSDEMPRRLEATLAVFAAESETDPRVVTLGLHPHLMGVPHRFGFLEKMLDLLRARDDTIFMTGSQIADWYESVSPPEAGG